MNPFLLVGAEFYGLSIWSSGFAWDKPRIPGNDLNQSNFPFYCKPKSLSWLPAQARAELTYDVSKYIRTVNTWTVQPLSVRNTSFDLIAYNARDLNLNYLYLSYRESRNLSKDQPPDSPISIPQYIHRGGSCGYSGGCNNMSPDTPEFADIYINTLPAKAVIYLWTEEPESSQQSPDMTFVIYFK